MPNDLPTKKNLRTAIGTILIAGLVFAAVYYRAELGSLVRTASETLAAQGPLGTAAFTVGGTLWITLFLPASWVFLAAGAVWGLQWGLLIALTANVAAGILSFALAKLLLVDRDEPAEGSKLALVRRVVQEEGFRGALLIRFSALPVWAVSYGLGAADITWKHFLLASVAVVPVTWTYVAGGHAAGLAAASESTSPGEWALLAGSIAATVAVLVLLGRRARRLLADR